MARELKRTITDKLDSGKSIEQLLHDIMSDIETDLPWDQVREVVFLKESVKSIQVIDQLSEYNKEESKKIISILDTVRNKIKRKDPELFQEIDSNDKIEYRKGRVKRVIEKLKPLSLVIHSSCIFCREKDSGIPFWNAFNLFFESSFLLMLKKIPCQYFFTVKILGVFCSDRWLCIEVLIEKKRVTFFIKNNYE